MFRERCKQGRHYSGAFKFSLREILKGEEEKESTFYREGASRGDVLGANSDRDSNNVVVIDRSRRLSS